MSSSNSTNFQRGQIVTTGAAITYKGPLINSSLGGTFVQTFTLGQPDSLTQRERAYLFSTRNEEAYGRIEGIEWSATPGIYNTKSGKLLMHTTTTKNHRRLKTGQQLGLVMPDDRWYDVVITALTSRGGSVSVESSECAGTIEFRVRKEHKIRPQKYFRASFPAERVPKFSTPEEAEAWLDAQSG